MGIVSPLSTFIKPSIITWMCAAGEVLKDIIWSRYSKWSLVRADVNGFLLKVMFIIKKRTWLFWLATDLITVQLTTNHLISCTSLISLFAKIR